MKTYAHFTTDGNGNLGSDAWYQLDGRNSRQTQKQDARERMQRLKAVQPSYNGFQIRVGEKPSKSRVVYAE